MVVSAFELAHASGRRLGLQRHGRVSNCPYGNRDNDMGWAWLVGFSEGRVHLAIERGLMRRGYVPIAQTSTPMHDGTVP